LYVYVRNDPGHAVDPFGLIVSPRLPGLPGGYPKKPTDPECVALRNKIDNIRKEISKRAGELRRDPLGLPGKCPGDKLKPSLSRRGHDMIINMHKRRLAELIGEYSWKCQDPPTPSPVPVSVPRPNPKKVAGFSLAAIGGTMVMVGVSGSAVLVADDTTVIGVVDDPLIVVTGAIGLIGGLILYFAD